MHTSSSVSYDPAVTTPYYESVARSFYSQFGDHALDLVDRAIENLEAQGPAFALDIWKEIRMTLLRKAPAVASVTIQ